MAKKKVVAPIPVADESSDSLDTYGAAKEKAKNPLMTTAGNPLAESPEQGLQERIVSTNMERLFQDARIRRGSNGAVYAGIMSQRFDGG